MEQNARLVSSLGHFSIHISSCVIALPSLTVRFLCSFPTGHETRAHGAGSGGSVLLPQTPAVHGLRRPLEARPKTITDSWGDGSQPHRYQGPVTGLNRSCQCPHRFSAKGRLPGLSEQLLVSLASRSFLSFRTVLSGLLNLPQSITIVLPDGMCNLFTLQDPE